MTTLGHQMIHRRFLRASRAWLSGAFAVTAENRAAIVQRMLEGHVRAAPTYWMQLSISLGIATLGLVLNSSAVIIGAMLVSPLMNPIVELGMGLAVGSPLLSIRSLVRTFWSIAVVIAGAALLTKALPFHEVTTEITARASPTALDLLVAIFCALAAAFITLRSASDNATTAAGAAIAIALVPPLCVVGFGLGTADRMIAEGAFLLFTANLSGILLFSVVTFWLFGFNLVDTRHLEDVRFSGPGPTGRSVYLAKRVFGSRYGTSLRLFIPVALVVVVLFPLSHALREVTWEVRTRAQIQHIIQELPLAQAAVRSSISIGHRVVQVRLVVVGNPGQARSLQLDLDTRISRLSGVTPNVVVVAVPDLDTMEDVARKFAKSVSEKPDGRALNQDQTTCEGAGSSIPLSRWERGRGEGEGSSEPNAAVYADQAQTSLRGSQGDLLFPHPALSRREREDLLSRALRTTPSPFHDWPSDFSDTL